jgi:hypothetical protein
VLCDGTYHNERNKKERRRDKQGKRSKRKIKRGSNKEKTGKLLKKQEIKETKAEISYNVMLRRVYVTNVVVEKQ